MKIALFVEGSHSPPAPRQRDALKSVWQAHFPDLAGRTPFSEVVPISKQIINNMDPSRASVRSSGNAETLDQLIIRKLRGRDAFDAAVIVWDLIPPLNTKPPLDPPSCGRAESKWVLERLLANEHLPPTWRPHIKARLREHAGSRGGTPLPARPVSQHEIRFLCMVPEFEDILLNEHRARALLDVHGRRVKGWPSDWAATPDRRGKTILHEAIEAARTLKPGGFPSIAGTMARTATNEWAEWMIRQMMAVPETRSQIAEHPFVQRILALLPPREARTPPSTSRSDYRSARSATARRGA